MEAQYNPYGELASDTTRTFLLLLLLRLLIWRFDPFSGHDLVAGVKEVIDEE
jgi:hypothetical protein